MAVLWLDSGGDHYTNPAHKWSSNNLATVVAGGGRNGTNCIQCSSSGRFVQKNLAAAIASGVIGFAFRRQDLVGSGAFCQILDNADLQVALNSHSNGSVSISGPGGSLGTTSPGLIVGGVYSYIEIKPVIHDTTGAATLRINGVAVLTLTNVDTQAGANATFDNFRLLGAGTNFQFDDVYILDTTGGAPQNDFLGDTRVQYRAPTGVGNSTGWTPSAGANWQNVDDAVPDEDATYNSALLVPSVDLYATEDLSGSPTTVFAVQAINRVREDDAGGHTIAPVLRASGVTDTGTAVSVNDTYDTKTEVWNANPDASAWDPADFPIEVGASLES